MDDTDYVLEDWKMTKDKISHFDDILFRTRLEGLPISTGLQAAAFAVDGFVGSMHLAIFGHNIPIFSLIMLASVFYLIPIMMLDKLYFKFLCTAVDHAESIEENNFENKIQITTKLTSLKNTKRHYKTMFLMYFVVMATGSFFFIMGITNMAQLVLNPN